MRDVRGISLYQLVPPSADTAATADKDITTEKAARMNIGFNASRDASGVACVIRARGGLDEDWSARLRGLQITVERDDVNAPVTVLRGELPDTAALNGVLTTLYSLGLSLVSVQSTPVSELPDDESQPNRR